MKWKRALVLIVTAVLFCTGCTEHEVKKDAQPGKVFSQYDRLTGLYGTAGRNEVLDQLGIDLQAVNIENGDHLGLPIQDTYAGLDFDIYLNFGHDDGVLNSVEYERVYRYPEEREQMIMDITTLCDQMILDFGDEADTEYVFEWAQKMLKEEWNQDIKVWQDAAILRRLMNEDYYGSILWWDMTSVASETVRNHLESRGKDYVHGLAISIGVSAYEGKAYIMINY